MKEEFYKLVTRGNEVFGYFSIRFDLIATSKSLQFLRILIQRCQGKATCCRIYAYNRLCANFYQNLTKFTMASILVLCPNVFGKHLQFSKCAPHFWILHQKLHSCANFYQNMRKFALCSILILNYPTWTKNVVDFDVCFYIKKVGGALYRKRINSSLRSPILANEPILKFSRLDLAIGT